jgi:hypothetical protein
VADHLLHIINVNEGFPLWKLTCEHDLDDKRWWFTYPNGEPVQPPHGCYLADWWDAIGSEMFDSDGPITELPVPVEPNDDWDYDNGGTIRPEREAHR